MGIEFSNFIIVGFEIIMSAVKEFNSWSLSSQIQVVFTLTVFLLSGIIVIITRLQLDWMENEVSSMSLDVLKGGTIDKMKILGRSQAAAITYEFKNYIRITENFNQFNMLVFGDIESLGQPLDDSTPLWIEDCDPDKTYYNSSTYNSKYGKAEEGTLAYNTIFNASRLNWILFDLYKENYLFLYEGFASQEILNSFPGSYFSSWSTYTPLVREWYHKALYNSNQVLITEPYSDASTGQWIITVSKALTLNNGTSIGVSATDITLQTITSQSAYINDIKGGYMIIATRAGLIISKPSTWNIGESVRIYDESKTGFSYDLWVKVKNADSGDDFDFTDVNGTSFTMVVDFIRPYDSEYVSHYILLFVENSEIEKPVKKMHEQFQDMKIILFWVVLAFELVIIIVAIVFIYFFSLKATKQLGAVNKVFLKVKRRAIYPLITKTSKFDKLDSIKNGIEPLVDACKGKVNNLTQEEVDFTFYKWGRTRPIEYHLYNEWADEIFPFNKYEFEKMPWRKVTENLKSILKSF